ncbi:uncharacterized protein PV06_02992 [Exophiala oligosperma]|uniref:Uncharacterized protein n=1 Tax=Exophiala oligosperma TaxID=215243 RepID=A0A0D2AXL7_9EURO|nr:uncharacterized protein PV06_02992 [Exophiala oligosperma]KIW44531.1 hypothetical protein PV06_02992 [Exophiala oligosperma]
MSRTIKITTRQAIQIAQNSENGSIDPIILHLLELALCRIWQNIQSEPDSYVMTQVEFAVFNYHRALPELQNETAREAISRYWDSHHLILDATLCNGTTLIEPPQIFDLQKS